MSSYTRKPWTEEVKLTQEDNAIRELVAEFGDRRWTAISQVLKDRYNIKGRSGKQCRERWHNHLDPNINKDNWTETEELKLFECQKNFGNKWSEIARYLPGRTDNSIKNHFYSTIRRNIRRYNKGQPKDKQLSGPIKSLLKREDLAPILLVPCGSFLPFKKKKLVTLEQKCCSDTTESGEEGSSILFKLYEEAKERAKSLVCPSPSKSPCLPQNLCFDPSTPTSQLLTSPKNQRVFKSPHEVLHKKFVFPE